MRFELMIHQDAPLDELVERGRLAQQLGFDAVYLCDHTGDYRDLSGYWLECWTALAVLARETDTIEIGTLVSNPVLRSPALLAKQALTVDQLSGGRLRLGIGTGIAGFDHAAAGVPYWPVAERVARFAEYLTIVEGLLRGERFQFSGQYYRTDGMPTNPGPIRQPRPTIVVGGQSPTVRRVAARLADCWNTHGPFGAQVDEIVRRTAEQNAEMDRLCSEHGRSPDAVRRSVLLFDALDPWHAPVSLPKLVQRFTEAGVNEFVLCWPPKEREHELDGIPAMTAAP